MNLATHDFETSTRVPLGATSNGVLELDLSRQHVRLLEGVSEEELKGQTERFRRRPIEHSEPRRSRCAQAIHR